MRRLESQRGITRGIRDSKSPAAAVVSRRQPFRLGFFAAGFQFFSLAHTPVGLAFVQQREGVAAIDLHAFGLTIGALVPIEPHPFHAFNDGLNGLVGRPVLVRVFDAQHKRPLLLPGEQPVEQGGPDSSDVKEPGRTGREADTYLSHAFISFLVGKGRYL